MSMAMWRVWTILLLCRIFLMFASNFQFRSCQLFCGEIFLYALCCVWLLVSKDLCTMIKFIDFCFHNHPHIKICCSQPSVRLKLRERRPSKLPTPKTPAAVEYKWETTNRIMRDDGRGRNPIPNCHKNAPKWLLNQTVAYWLHFSHFSILHIFLTAWKSSILNVLCK